MKFIGKGPALLKLKRIKNVEVPKLILISYKEYSERKKTKRVTLYDTSEEASEHVKEYYSHVGGSTKS